MQPPFMEHEDPPAAPDAGGEAPRHGYQGDRGPAALAAGPAGGAVHRPESGGRRPRRGHRPARRPEARLAGVRSGIAGIHGPGRRGASGRPRCPRPGRRGMGRARLQVLGEQDLSPHPAIQNLARLVLALGVARRGGAGRPRRRFHPAARDDAARAAGGAVAGAHRLHEPVAASAGGGSDRDGAAARCAARRVPADALSPRRRRRASV